MNKAKLDKEKKNVKLLFQYFSHFGFQHGFWTFADAICARLKIQKAYEYADWKRYEICKAYLRKHYGNLIDSYLNAKLEEPIDKIHEDSNIWIFWWQGEENLPYPVNLCIQSIRRHAGKHPVVVITEKNYKDYVELPEKIMRKFSNGIISLATFSDILRFELLYMYGGIWLDSTYYFTGDIQPEVYENSFFSISIPNGRKYVVTKDIWSISFMAMTKNHPIAKYMRDAFREYWKSENITLAYLLVDCFMAIGYEDVPLFRKIINAVPANNEGVFDMLTEIRNIPCSKEDYLSKIVCGRSTYIHKLTYKERFLEEVNGQKTYFGWLICSESDE